MAFVEARQHTSAASVRAVPAQGRHARAKWSNVATDFVAEVPAFQVSSEERLATRAGHELLGLVCHLLLFRVVERIVGRSCLPKSSLRTVGSRSWRYKAALSISVRRTPIRR
jgi:hypothetical protein